MSLSYKVLELLKKHAAANNKKGVVGNSGTKIPMTPNVNDNNPNIVNNIFIFLFKVQSSKFRVQSSEFGVQSQILFSFHFANFIYIMQMNASMLPYNISAVQTH